MFFFRFREGMVLGVCFFGFKQAKSKFSLDKKTVYFAMESGRCSMLRNEATQLKVEIQLIQQPETRSTAFLCLDLWHPWAQVKMVLAAQTFLASWTQPCRSWYLQRRSSTIGYKEEMRRTLCVDVTCVMFATQTLQCRQWFEHQNGDPTAVKMGSGAWH